MGSKYVMGALPPTWYVDMNGTITSTFIGATEVSGQWINTGALW